MDLRWPMLLVTWSVVTFLKTVTAGPIETPYVSPCPEKENPLYRKKPSGPINYPRYIGFKNDERIPEYKWRLLPASCVTCVANYDEGQKHLILDFIPFSGLYDFRPACKKYIKEKFIPKLKDVVLRDLIFSMKAVLSVYLAKYDLLKTEIFGEKPILFTRCSDKEFVGQIDDLEFVLSQKLIASNDAPTPDFDLFRKLIDEPLGLYLAVRESVSPSILSPDFRPICPSKRLKRATEETQKMCTNQYFAQLRQNAKAGRDSLEELSDPSGQEAQEFTSWAALENGIKFLMRNAGKSEEEANGFELKLPMIGPCYP